MKQAPLFMLMAALACSSASGGSVRYELTDLLGEHVYDGVKRPLSIHEIDAPFGMHEVKEAQLVVAGRVSPGRARGDGVLRQAESFELLPDVGVPTTLRGAVGGYAVGPPQATPGVFRLEYRYLNPFVPEVTPLPNPDGYQFLHSVGVGVGPSHATDLPRRLDAIICDPSVSLEDCLLIDWPDVGVIIEQPIVAHIDRAFIVLSGPTIIPEPCSLSLAILSLLLHGRSTRSLALPPRLCASA